MSRANLNDLQSFLIVAQEKSFTKAAAKLGVSQSALSHTVRQLEARLNLTLLIRTTRSVTPTSAGEYLIQNMAPHFDQIEKQLASIGELRNQPTGTIRITSTDDAIAYVIRPKIKGFLQKYPGVKIELVSDLKLVDIFTEKFDAAIRLGENVTKEMASIPLMPDIRFTVVGSPEYFQNNLMPETPQDLLKHQCITIRLPTHGGIYAWEFEKAGRDIKIRVDGPLILTAFFLFGMPVLMAWVLPIYQK